MARFNRFDNGAPSQQVLESNDVAVGRSAHNFSYSIAGNTMPGLLAMIDNFDVVPNEDIDISITSLIEFRNPAKRQLMNGFRVFFHTRYNRLSDLWEGANNWLDNGRSGKLKLTRPNLIFHKTFSFNDTTYEIDANTPMSLLNFMGLPATSMMVDTASAATKNYKRVPLRQFETAFDFNYKTGSSDPGTKVATRVKLGEYTDYFPADAAFMYQRAWRDFYAPKNLLQNNDHWFPDNEDHFILSYDCEDAVAIEYENEDFGSDPSTQDINIARNLIGRQEHVNIDSNSISSWDNFTQEPYCPNPTPGSQITAALSPNLAGIKFVQFRGDRFSTGSPFPDLIRGEMPIIDLSQEKMLQAQFLNHGENVYPIDGQEGDLYDWNVTAHYGIDSDNKLHARFQGQTDSDKMSLQVPLTFTSSITMSDIYTLETLTAFKRKMGMTNGDYNEMIKSQYGYDPNVHDRKSIYIGGFYQDFAIQTVTQMSESNDTPLGTKASNGISSGSGSIGHFHTPDFGWIQTYMFIVPDVYYTQGKPRQFSKKSNLEMYFPIFNNLPAQAIRNDELFISGNATTDSAPFNYEDRYAEYKSRTNRVCGFMGLSHSVAAYDTARIMSRRFSSTPSFNGKFVSLIPENVDYEVFSVVDEPPFDFNVGVQVRRVFPGPYAAVEGSLSSPKLNAI